MCLITLIITTYVYLSIFFFSFNFAESHMHWGLQVLPAIQVTKDSDHLPLSSLMTNESLKVLIFGSISIYLESTGD